MRTSAWTPLVVAALCAASGCGKLATERAVLSAAQADSPTCPGEQMHVVGPVDVEGDPQAHVYEVRVCDRTRYYEETSNDDGERVFTRAERPAGVEGNAGLWAETDGAQAPAQAEPSSGGEDDDFDL